MALFSYLNVSLALTTSEWVMISDYADRGILSVKIFWSVWEATKIKRGILNLNYVCALHCETIER